MKEEDGAAGRRKQGARKGTRKEVAEKRCRVARRILGSPADLKLLSVFEVSRAQESVVPPQSQLRRDLDDNASTCAPRALHELACGVVRQVLLVVPL